MRLKQLGPNQAELITNHEYRILYSYETPVAGYSPLIGWFKVNKKYSVTTTRHINKYLGDISAVALSPETIEQMGQHIGD